MKCNRNDRRPTWTSLVLEALVQADDFLNLTEIMARTGASTTRATAALHHLCKSRAIESVVGGDEKLWWFATPGAGLAPAPRRRARAGGAGHSAAQKIQNRGFTPTPERCEVIQNFGCRPFHQPPQGV